MGKINIEVITSPDVNPDVVRVNGIAVAHVDQQGRVSAVAGGPVASGGAVASGGGGGYQSEVAWALGHKPISLAWRYPSVGALSAAIAEKSFPQRVLLVAADGTESTVSDGVNQAAGVVPVRYFKQSDNSVVYEPYLKDLENAGSSGRSEPLDVYPTVLAMQNDMRAIGNQQIVNVDGLRAFPPEGEAGFGPAYEYHKMPDGSIQRAGAAGGEVITIEDL